MHLASGSLPEIFHSDQGCQSTSTEFSAGCRQMTSAGLEEGVPTTIYWWKGFGEQLSTRSFICVPIAMAGSPKIA